MFYKTVPAQPKAEKKANFNLKKIALSVSLLFFLVVILYQVFLFGNKVVSRWNEISFAFSKPAIVEVVRKDYSAKQAKLEQSFLIKDKSAEEKLVESVVKKLQEDSLK